MDFYSLQVEQLDALERWLQGQEPVVYRNLARSVVSHIEKADPLRLEMEALVTRASDWSDDDVRGVFGDRKTLLYQHSLERQAALAWHVWKLIPPEATRANCSIADLLKGIASSQGTRPVTPSDKEHGLRNVIHGVLVSPLIAYLRGFVARRVTESYVMRRYKQRVEWFRRSDVRALAGDADTRRQEDRLQRDLYAFCFDHGLPFVTEGESPSGKLDFMGPQPEGRRLLAEVKVYAPEQGKPKGYVLGGYKQIRRYMEDYAENVGYLVIFNTTTDELRLTDLDHSTSLPAVVAQGTMVFVVVVELAELPSASEKDKRRLVEVAATEFLAAKTC